MLKIHTVISNYANLTIIICLPTVIRFQVFQSNTANFQVDLFDLQVSPVGWGWRIRRLPLCRWVRTPPTGVLHMTINHPIVRLQSWSFGNVNYSSLPLLSGTFVVYRDEGRTTTIRYKKLCLFILS